MVIVDQFVMRLVVSIVEVADGRGRMDRMVVIRMTTGLAVAVAIIGRRTTIGRFGAVGVIGGDLDGGFFGEGQ